MTVVNISNKHDQSCVLNKKDILTWVNSTLNAKLNKMEELRTGAAYCQMTFMLFPNCLLLKKVNFNAKAQHEYESNFGILQNCFEKLGVKRDVPVQSLVSGNVQENLDFAQWFKRFFDANIVNATPDLPTATDPAGGHVEGQGQQKNRSSCKSPSSLASGKSFVVRDPPSRSSAVRLGRQSASLWKRSPDCVSAGWRRPKSPVKPAVDREHQAQEMDKAVTSLRRDVTQLSMERDFYFGKLREIELICQHDEKAAGVANVLDVIYATEEGFSPPDFTFC